jgi:hypothetical protein
MNKVLGSRDNQMTKIDEKINELISLRKQLAVGRDRELQKLLDF